MIVTLEQKIAPELLLDLCRAHFKTMVKFVADIERGIIAVGGELHADAEAVLLENGSRQEYLWGGNLYPFKPPVDRIEYTSFINIRPRDNNTGMEIGQVDIREKVDTLVKQLLLDDDEVLS